MKNQIILILYLFNILLLFSCGSEILDIYHYSSQKLFYKSTFYKSTLIIYSDSSFIKKNYCIYCKDTLKGIVKEKKDSLFFYIDDTSKIIFIKKNNFKLVLYSPFSKSAQKYRTYKRINKYFYTFFEKYK